MKEFVKTLEDILCRVVVQHELGVAVFNAHKVDPATLPPKVQETIELMDAVLLQEMSAKDNIRFCLLKKELGLPSRVDSLFTYTALKMFEHNNNALIPGGGVVVERANEMFAQRPQKEFFMKENSLERFNTIFSLFKELSGIREGQPSEKQFHEWTKFVFQDASKEVIKSFLRTFLKPGNEPSFEWPSYTFRVGVNVFSSHNPLLQLCWRNMFDRELFDSLHTEGSVHSGSERILHVFQLRLGRDFTATDLACGHDNVTLLDWLLKNGQPLNPSAADWALSCKQVEMCERLTKQYGFVLTDEQTVVLANLVNAKQNRPTQ